MSATPSFAVNKPCKQVVGQISQRLEEAGLRAIQTFDLQDARQTHGDCTCPYHGTTRCDCQMIVLLVYAEGMQPVSLVAHGNEGKTWLSLVEAPQHTLDQDLKAILRQVFASLDDPVSNHVTTIAS